MSGKRRQYDRDFKISAVKLLESSEDSSEQVARSLGISGSMLRRWRNQIRSRQTFLSGARAPDLLEI